MELELFITGVTTVGLPTMLVAVLLWHIDKKDKLNREDTNIQIRDLKNDVKELKVENKEERELFSKAVDGFNMALVEFKTIGDKMNCMEKDVDKIKDDVLEIKNRI